VTRLRESAADSPRRPIDAPGARAARASDPGDRLAAIAARVTDALAIAFFVAMFACVLAQVVFRYFLGSPLTWSDELARYLFVWCAFLAG